MAHITTNALSEKEQEFLKNFVTVRRKGQIFKKTDPGDCILPEAYERYKEAMFHFKVRDDDVYVLTFPKNGTTW